MADLNSQTKITELEFPDSVRQIHEVYLNGPNHCIYEILDNSIDEAKAGVCNTILLSIDKNHLVTVQDNGRGIPVAPTKKDPAMSQAERALSTLTAGGKYSGKDGSYNVNTAGKNGVGSSCVNAVSSYFEADIAANGKLYQIIFKQGKFVQKQKVIKEIPAASHGTVIRFLLDNEIYPNANFDYQALMKRVQQSAFLNPKLTIAVNIDTIDTNGKEVKVMQKFKYDDGLDDYLSYVLKNKEKSIEGNLSITKDIENDKKLGQPINLDIRYTFINSFNSEVKGFVNGIPSDNGGDQINGFNQGITKAIRQYALEQKQIKSELDFEINDCTEGLVSLINVQIKKPIYKGQHKDALKMPAVASIVSSVIKDNLYDYMSKYPKEAKIIVEKALRARKERLAIKKAKEDVRGMKQINDKTLTLGKLADCASKKPEDCEIFIVEGDSAAGSAKQARDRMTQAILPIFGKISNYEKKSDVTLKSILKDVKLGIIVAALKAGVGETFDIKKLRYHKIIIFSDADVDGGHIICLYITFFYRYMPEIIKNGNLYVACPPLFKASKGIVKETDVNWFYNDKELNEFLKENNDKGFEITRYKGLGEMNPDQLWETTMDPENRRLKQITIENAENAEKSIDICMGDNVSIRKEFLFKTI